MAEPVPTPVAALGMSISVDVAPGANLVFQTHLDRDSEHRARDKGPECSFQLTAGHYVGVSVGVGSTVRQAAREAYKTCKAVSMPVSHFYRDDIGRRLKTDLPKLQDHGFAKGAEY